MSIEDIESKLTELEQLRTKAEAVHSFVREIAADKQAEIDTLQEQVDENEDRMAQIREEIKEVDPEAWQDYLGLRQEIQVAEVAIKQLGYALPADVLRKGTKIAGTTLSITVSKTQYVVSYDMVAMSGMEMDLVDELREITFDGDPVIAESIDADILERAVESGLIDSERVAPYRTEVKKKNPGVSIKEKKK